MSQTLCVSAYSLIGPRKGDEYFAYTPLRIVAVFTFLSVISDSHFEYWTVEWRPKRHRAIYTNVD